MKKLKISPKHKKLLLNASPTNYTGIAEKLARNIRRLLIMNEITDEINKTMHVVKSLNNDIFTKIETIVNLCVDKITNHNKILLAGNGGSAGDAQHMAGELVSRFKFDRPAISALALTTDTSIMTAIGNDYGYEHIFARQIEANGNIGDVFIAYSTSGNSQNILNALELSKRKEIITVGMTGNKKGK